MSVFLGSLTSSFLWGGVLVTLEVFAVAAVGGLVCGTAVALMRESLFGLPENGAPRTPVRTRLDDALNALSLLLREIPATSVELAAYMAALAPLAGAAGDTAAALAREYPDAASSEAAVWALATRSTINSHLRDIAAESGDGGSAVERRLVEIADTARGLAQAMRFDFLFERDRKLLSIGYRVAEGELDPNCYDLLASEARLASFVAIANGDLPARHWFRLGRAVTPIHRGAALVSWSGSMFEYLMPSLVMRAPADSLLEQTSRLIVWRQKDYGAELGVPWGISESAYNARDLEFTYQYSSFGVPGLGLKRGLGESIVIAPYATALAAMVDPSSAALNFARLADAGGQGLYGFYEALDYTPRRLPVPTITPAPPSQIQTLLQDFCRDPLHQARDHLVLDTRRDLAVVAR